MTQSFTFREPASNLGHEVLPQADMMPPWKQSAAYNLLPNDGTVLEKQGQKRRRESELIRGLMPNERFPNDSIQQSGNGPSTDGNNICDLDAAQSAFAVDKQNLFDRMQQSVRSGTFPSMRGGVSSTNQQPNHQQYNNESAYRLSQRPAARSLALAAAATAQAMANFKALIDESRKSSSLFQAYSGAENGSTQGYASIPSLSAPEGWRQQLQSNHGFGVPSFRATENYFNSSIGNHNGYEKLSCFGDANTNGPMRSEINVTGSETNWPNLNCQTSVSNASRSVFETNPEGLEEPQSPCTPGAHQQVVDTVLSDSQKEFLKHMERINSIAATEPESPRHQNPSQGRRSRTAIFGGFEPARPVSDFQVEKHVHIYIDPLEVPKHVEVSHAAEIPVLEASTEFSSGILKDAQLKRFRQSVESAPVMAPAESSNELKFTGGNKKFDLNEVPIGVGEAATPKLRKKYHPRVAKDKRTYKRRVDGKKDPASLVNGFRNMGSPAEKAGKRSSNQTQYDLTSEEGRDASYPEVVDMDIEYNGCMHTTTSQHDTAVCDCEACIKLRLEKRIPQSPVSPPQHHSWQSTLPRGDSSSNSLLIRRTLFQPSALAPEVLVDQGSEQAARRPVACFDTTNYDLPKLNSLMIPQDNTAYSAVKTFFSTSRTATSCLQQVDETAAQLGLIHNNNRFSSQLIPASHPSPTYSYDNRVPATHSNNYFMSRLCPRGILFPQTVSFRNMTQIQRVVYLRSFLSSIDQLKMSPESLLKHVHDFITKSEKNEFKEVVWPLVLAHMTDDQEKQLSEYAKSEQVGAPSAIVEAMKPRGPGKARKPSKKELVMTVRADSQAMKSNSKAGKGEKGRKTNGGAGAAGNEIISQNALEMVLYENKSMVPYDGPFNPLRKKKNRAKVVLDDETVRVWKLLMGKRGSEGVETDAEKELKWEEERQKMKVQAQTFIDRMHLVIGDRSFSKWKGSVVDSVVGAFLTQNVNDVLSSSAFMSMRSRYPGRGVQHLSETKGADPEEVVAQSFESEHPSLPAQFPPMQPQSSGISEAATSSQHPSPQDTAALQPDTECPSLASVTVFESQESRNEESYEILHKEVPASTQVEQPGVLELQSFQKEDSKTSNSVLTDELSTGANQTDVALSPENGIIQDLITESQPSQGKYNPKTGLTGLERAKIEEKQVSARKDFDFSEMQDEFKPRVQGQERLAAPARTEATEDCVDWEAVRRADVAEVADVIKERGLNWILAGRIKAFLERMHQDYGALDLEWLRSMSTDQTKEFLLSIRGLGLKSVECIRLLTLHHLAFPVDTNVGRICVRLGWVPLEPLPEELQLHLLELYPVQATIQKYLWPRLCKFDHRTLYELHYQMITFGKVFCTKTKPNCNACPMRPECKHFASALSSAKFALPASERPNTSPTLALPPGENIVETSRPVSQYCQPIIEEPMTPESEVDMEDLDIEDYPFSVQELIEDDTSTCIQDHPSIEAASTHVVLQQCDTIHILNRCSPSIDVSISDTERVSELASEHVLEVLLEPVQESTITEDSGGLAAATSRSNIKQGSYSNNVVEIVDTIDDLKNLDNPSALVPNVGSQEMVLVGLEATSLPVPNLKNIGRLRTVHYVYELPDNHPLLDGLDPRESDDPCTYLLAIWSPGEVPESIPNINDTVNEENGPFASEGEESIKATLLVPCRTAMRGSFPLNGTYFQVNEVFADHASSLQPMLVPRTLLWNLRRRFVFFGTSVTSIFRGMTAAEIQACFWRGYVCVRGFDRLTRAPKPLVGRLHLQAGKAKGANVDA